jgi:hypothetical protein
LNKDRTKRLGANGDVQEILSHPFFSDIDANKLLSQKIIPPFLPQQAGSGGLTDFYDNHNSKQDLEETILPEANLSTIKKNKDAFTGFSIVSK